VCMSTHVELIPQGCLPYIYGQESDWRPLDASQRLNRYTTKPRHWCNRARQLYTNISMLFLFPVKDGKLSTGVIAIFNASRYG